jgi:hypothetical protein
MQSASIAQDPRAYALYGANPSLDRKAKVRKLVNKLKNHHPRPHRKDLVTPQSEE